MKKLIAKEFAVTEVDVSAQYKAGEKYSHFMDPETGKFYRPVDGFTVTGKDLSDRFVEIDMEEVYKE
jgi:hypothetical protein